MVQFLKAKDTQYINKPIGVVNADTGSRQAQERLAKVASNMATQGFQKAITNQKLLGEQEGRNLEIDIRDSNGLLGFKELPSTLSDIARASAEPIVRQRYGEALKVDVFNIIGEIKTNSKTSAEFKEKVETQMGQYVQEISKLGGGEYESLITNDIAKISSQYFNDMATDEFKEAQIIAAKNKQIIITTSRNDYITATAQLVKNGSTNIQELIKDFEDSKVVRNKLIQENQSNLTENNQNPAIFAAENRKLGAAPAIGLVRGLLKNKSEEEIRDIRAAINGNQDVTLKPFDQKIVDLIKKEKKNDQVLAEIQNTLTPVAQDNAVARAKANNNDRIQAKREKDSLPNENPLANAYYNQERDNYNNTGESIGDDIANSETLSAENIAKINEVMSDINSSIKFKYVDYNGRKIGYKLSRDDVNATQSSFLNKIAQRIIAKDNLFETSAKQENLITYIMTGNKSTLSEKQIEVGDRINKLFDNIKVTAGDLEFGVDKKYFKDKLVINSTYLSNLALKAEENNKKIKSLEKNNKAATGGWFQNSQKNRQDLDDYHFPNGDGESYFMLNLAEDLKDEDETEEKDKALEIVQQLENGAIPQSLMNIFNRSVNSNATAPYVDSALNYFNKLTNISKSGGYIDVLKDVLSEDVYNKLSIASVVVPLYKGEPAFGIEIKEGMQGVDSGQLMQKIVETEQTMDKEKNFFKDKLNILADGDTSIQTSAHLLAKKYEFNVKEANEISPVMDIMIAMGLDKETIKTHMETIRDNLYPTGEGTVIDVRGSTKEVTRSRYSFLRMIKDPVNRTKVRMVISQELQKYKPKRKETDKEKSFYLNWQPTQAEKSLMIRTGSGLKDLRAMGIKEDEQVAVFLHPDPQGPDDGNIMYQAVYKDYTGNFSPVYNENGNAVVFFLNDLLQRVDPDYDEDL